MRRRRHGFLPLAALVVVGIAHGDTVKPRPTNAPAAFKVIDKLLDFGDERKALTLAYRKQHYGEDRDSIEIEPRMIVLHWTDTPTMKSTWKAMNRLTASSSRKKLKAAGDVNVSAHFLVDRDGTVYRLVPETWMARHTIGLNEVAIGVENVGDGEAHPLTAKQVQANAALVRMLAGKFSLTHLIGHQEYRAMEGHPYFRERDPAYRNEKPDPGKAFMKRVRALVADLKLLGPPDRRALPAAGATGATGAVVKPTRVLVLSAVDGGVPDDTAKRVVAGQRVSLLAVAEVGGQLHARAPRVKLAGKLYDARPLDEALAKTIEWRKLEPEAENLSNTGTGKFSYAAIGYGVVPVARWAGKAEISADVRPTLTTDRGHGLGTMRYQVVIGGVASPGVEARRGRASGGLVDDVHRVSIRRDDSFLGYLTEMFGQPYIWASAGSNDRVHQSERLEGSDCADLMTYGWRRAGNTVPYTWTEGLKGLTRKLAAGSPGADGIYTDAKGQPLAFPKVGDLLLFPRHVGALVADRGVPGVLDTADVMMHTFFKSPAEEAVAVSGYGDAPLEVRRWK